MTTDLITQIARDVRRQTLLAESAAWSGEPNIAENLKARAQQMDSGEHDDQLAELMRAIELYHTTVGAPLAAALTEARQQLWVRTRDRWTRSVFAKWETVQRIDAALALLPRKNAAPIDKPDCA